MLIDFSQEDFLEFEYQYSEFDQYSYLDSTTVLVSFNGKKTVYIDSILYYLPDSIKYLFSIKKEGIKVTRTFFDTVSVDEISTISNDFIVEKYNTGELGGTNHIYGWIFQDSLCFSLEDSMDVLPPYPYLQLYRYYFPENDDSLYVNNDTLFIHYRSNLVNFNDSYNSVDFQILKNQGLKKYSSYYSYFGCGFEEDYKLVAVGIGSSIKKSSKIHSEFHLKQNCPNPFNPKTKIEFYIRKSGIAELIIYNQLGEKIVDLLNEHKSAGTYEIEFDASSLSSGIYFYTLKLGSSVQTRKMLLIK
jgi:hypothetical protein